SIAWTLSCAMLLTFTACLDEDDPAPNIPVAYVSLYHGSPDAPALDIEVDNNQINTAPFNYAEYTGYLRFYTGDRNLKFGPYASSSVNIDTTVTFEPDKAYSVFVTDEFENSGVLILNDNADPAASGKANVRIINLSPDAGDINFMVAEATGNWTEDLGFKEATEFMEVDAGEFDFQVRASDTDELLLSIPDVNLQSRYFYTIIIRGYDSPPNGNTNVLAAQVVVN
ncbi:MAG TPA: DUF4397 domain-containing protein, partial [Cyclobacteriaceae bacterium]|nr:DUF4397 domain-containing protein [Cyclobacteriaceae bacterium]